MRPENSAQAGGDASAFFDLRAAGFSVAGKTLLQPLDLRIPKGRTIALVGHNGSGKSTLLKLLAGQQAPTSGSVLFDGRPVADWPVRGFARRVAYLAQTQPPATGMLVRELVALGRYPWHGTFGRIGPSDRARIAEAIRLTGLEGLSDRLVDTLSGGERQRAWLAMLIAQDTDCLLLDEPISALDIAHQIEVLALVRRLSHDRNLGVVVVLHDINMAARYCDEIIALHSGSVIDRGTPGTVMTPERLQAIYGVPMRVMDPGSAGGSPVAIAM